MTPFHPVSAALLATCLAGAPLLAQAAVPMCEVFPMDGPPTTFGVSEVLDSAAVAQAFAPLARPGGGAAPFAVLAVEYPAGASPPSASLFLHPAVAADTGGIRSPLQSAIVPRPAADRDTVFYLDVVGEDGAEVRALPSIVSCAPVLLNAIEAQQWIARAMADRDARHTRAAERARDGRRDPRAAARTPPPSPPPPTLRPLGNVSVGMWVDASGQPRDIEIVESSGDRAFDREVIRLYRALRFEPATVSGIPIGVRVQLPIAMEYR
jgi:TonB family protein